MVFKEFNKERWVPLDVPVDATDTQITAAVGRVLVAADEDRAKKELPVATGQLARIRKLCLLELDRLELTDTVRRARGKHVDACSMDGRAVDGCCP